MASPSDLGAPILSLTVRECRPRYEAKQDLDRDGRPDIIDTGSADGNVLDKYLYVFSASGADYGIGESTPGWLSRTHFGSGLQHAASPGEPTNPKPSGGKKATRVEMEVYFDLSGALWPLDLSSTHSKARHLRPHPKYERDIPTTDADRARRDRELRDLGQYGQDALRLPLVDSGKGPKRYYFLLSPFRLGPKALAAALDNPDALSLWYSGARATKEKKLVAKSSEDLPDLNGTVFVVDPYAFGQNACADFFEHGLINFFGMLGQVKAGTVPGVSRAHFDTRANQGTIEDLHFIATVLSQVQSSDSDVWKLLDQDMIQEVVGGYGQALAHRGAACEMGAAFLANWMSGPAHSILDTCVVEDLEDPADPFAGDDKGAAICYWHSQTRLMQGTGAGTAFLRRMMIDGPRPSPIRDLLKRYAKPGTPLKPGSTDEAAFTMAAAIVPDLVLRWLYRLEKNQCGSDGLPDPDKAPDAAGQIADIMNNLGYFGAELGNEAKARQKLPGDYLAEMAKKVGKHIPKAAIYIVGDAPAKVSSVKRDGRSVFEVSDKGWVADRYFRSRVLKRNTFFSADQLSRVRDTATLGGSLQEITRQGDELVDEAKGAVEKIREQLRELNRAKGDVVKVQGSISKIERELTYLAEQEKRTLRQLDLAREANKAPSRKAIDLRKQPLPTDPMQKAARLKAIEAADAAVIQTSKEITRHQQTLRDTEARAGALKEAKKPLEKVLGEHEATRRAREAARGVLEDAQKAARQGRQAASQFGKVTETIEDEAAKFADTRKWGLNAAKVFVSFASLGIEITYLGRQLEDPNAKSSKTAWAAADAGKAVLDVTKDLMKFHGVRDVEFAKFLAEQEKKAGESLLRRQALAGYAKSVVQPANAMTALAFVGAIAGAYSVAKYGAQGLEAIETGDTSVAIGAGIAVLGGALTVWSAMGFGIAGSALTAGIGMSATGVGTLAGILVIIGALIIAFSTDSEWEFFAKHCYFAKGSRRNTRPSSKGADHWLGEVEDKVARADADLWNVRSQRLALQRLLARYSVSSSFGFSNWPTEDSPALASSVEGKPVTIGGTIIVDFQHWNIGSTLRIELVRTFNGAKQGEPIVFRFTDKDVNQGAVKVGPDLIGHFVRPGGGGFLCLIIRDREVPRFGELAVKSMLILDEGEGKRTTIESVHPLLRLRSRTSVATDTPVTHVWLEHVGDPTFSETFAHASDPVFRG